jgi:hypothetical protein
MAIVRADGFNNVSTSTGSGSATDINAYLTKNYTRVKWQSSADPYLFSGRVTGKCLALGRGTNAEKNWIEVPTGNVSEVIYGFSYRPPIYRNATQNDWIEFIEYSDQEGGTSAAGNIQVQFELADCSFIVRRGTSGRIAEQMGAFHQQRWNHIEIRIVFDDTAGELDVKINGDLLVSKTGIDTNNGGSDKCDAIRIHGVEGPSTSDEDFIAVSDDWYVLDTTGTIANSSIAPNVIVDSLLPDGAGDSTQFTPTSGANYTNVNSGEPDGTDYNASSTTGHKDLFTMSDLVHIGTGSSIYGLEVTNTLIPSGPGLVALIPKVKEGTTEGDGTTYKTIDANEHSDARHVFEVNPDTSSAWTVTEVNAIQCGYEVG